MADERSTQPEQLTDEQRGAAADPVRIPTPQEVSAEPIPTAPARELLNRHEISPPPDAGRKPQRPGEVSKRGWKDTAKRAFSEFMDDGCMDLAAALTYHSVMSIFPMLIATVSLLGVFGQGPSTTQAVLDMLADLGVQESTRTSIQGIVDQLQSSSGAGIGLVLGVVMALWSASNYVNGFSRAMNGIYDVQEGRPMVKLRLAMLAITAIILVAIVVVGLSLVLTGPVAEVVGRQIGLGGAAVTVWNIAKWPLVALVVMGIIGLLYWGTPNVRQPRTRWISPGSVLAFLAWALASGLFGLYVANFGSYNKTYGTMAGVIVFLLWLWITNNVLLLGAELDAELERSRQLEAGMPAETGIHLPLRGTKTLEKKAEKEEKLIEAARELRLENARNAQQAQGASPRD